MQFHLSNPEVREKRFELCNSKLDLVGKEITHNLPKITNKNLSLPGLSSSMASSLSDAGGNFTHPDKGNLTSDDVFVYPELEEKFSEENIIISSDGLVAFEESALKVLILGDDKSGKTFLLKRFFQDIHSHGRIPLYIDAHNLKSVSTNNLQKILGHLASEQYTSANDFLLAKKSSRVALLDDIDRCPGGGSNKYKLISFLEDNFESVIITGSSSMEISELIDKKVAESLNNYTTYEIRSFGHLMRHKLIKNGAYAEILIQILILIDKYMKQNH
ncbi:MAG: AAA family ATPase [Sedimenticola sp.]